MDKINNLKSKITYENKTIFGIVGIMLVIFGWVTPQPYYGILPVLILVLPVLPALFLIIPSETIKNSKVLAIIFGIIHALFFILLIVVILLEIRFYLPLLYWYPLSAYQIEIFFAHFVLFVLSFYGLFCSLLLSIQTKPNQKSFQGSNENLNNEKRHDKYCVNCGTRLTQEAKFCSNCGTQVN